MTFLVATNDRGDVVGITATLASQIATRQQLRYASYAYDAHSAAYYLSARHYDPATARFLTKDPARDDGEESAYQYCAGDPVGKVDPTGQAAGKFKPPYAALKDHTPYLMDVLRVNAGYCKMQRKTWAIFAFRSFTWFANMVGHNKPWDLKRAYPEKSRGRKLLAFKGQLITPEQFGNMHYGYVGAAYGYALEFLYMGSLKAHVDTYGLKSAFKSANLSNEFHDRTWVKKGWNLYWRNGSKIGCPVDRVVK